MTSKSLAKVRCAMCGGIGERAEIAEKKDRKVVRSIIIRHENNKVCTLGIIKENKKQSLDDLLGVNDHTPDNFKPSTIVEYKNFMEELRSVIEFKNTKGHDIDQIKNAILLLLPSPHSKNLKAHRQAVHKIIKHIHSLNQERFQPGGKNHYLKAQLIQFLRTWNVLE